MLWAFVESLLRAGLFVDLDPDVYERSDYKIGSGVQSGVRELAGLVPGVMGTSMCGHLIRGG